MSRTGRDTGNDVRRLALGPAEGGGTDRDGTGIRLGYACVNTQLPSPARPTRLANATRSASAS